MAVRTRVQTEWTLEEGGDGHWYAGTIVALYPGGGRATIEYDDGDLWTGSLSDVYMLRDDDEDDEAGLAVGLQPTQSGSYAPAPAASAIPTAAGVPLAVGRRVR